MQKQIQAYLLKKGASKVGFADISHLPEKANKGFKSAICIGVALNPAVIADIPTGPHISYSMEYNRANALLNFLGSSAERLLKEAGYNAYAVTGDRAPYDPDTCVTDLPHKTVARLAGFGWIGKNALLVTEEYGSAIRLTTVLCDKEFVCGAPVPQGRCGSCTVCEKACPGGAIKGVAWEEGTDRDSLVSYDICQKTVSERGKELPLRSALCGLCYAKCPYTLRYLRKTQNETMGFKG